MILCNPHNKISKILFKNCKMKMEKWDKNGKSINAKWTLINPFVTINMRKNKNDQRKIFEVNI